MPTYSIKDQGDVSPTPEFPDYPCIFGPPVGLRVDNSPPKYTRVATNNKSTQPEPGFCNSAELNEEKEPPAPEATIKNIMTVTTIRTQTLKSVASNVIITDSDASSPRTLASHLREHGAMLDVEKALDINHEICKAREKRFNQLDRHNAFASIMIMIMLFVGGGLSCLAASEYYYDEGVKFGRSAAVPLNVTMPANSSVQNQTKLGGHDGKGQTPLTIDLPIFIV